MVSCNTAAVYDKQYIKQHKNDPFNSEYCIHVTSSHLAPCGFTYRGDEVIVYHNDQESSASEIEVLNQNF